MGPRTRRLALTAHILSSVGWIGAAVVYLAICIAAFIQKDSQLVLAVYRVLEPAYELALVPLAIASLVTGLLSAIGTPWGLFRHYWVLIKLILTSIAVLILLGNFRTVRSLSDMAMKSDHIDLGGLESQILHSGGGLAVLIVVVVLGIYKPKGLTPYGWRKQMEMRP